MQSEGISLPSQSSKRMGDEIMTRISIQEYVLTGKYLKLKNSIVENRVNEMTKLIGRTIQYLHTYGVILRDLDAKHITIS